MEGGDSTVLHKRGLSKKGVWLLIAFVSAGFTAVYMQIEPRWLVCAVVFALLYWRLSRGVAQGSRDKAATPPEAAGSAGAAPMNEKEPRKKRGCIACPVVAATLSASIVLGYHIAIMGSAYSGTIDTSFITPYSWLDVPAFFFIGFAAWVLLDALRERASRAGRFAPDMARVPVNWVLACAAILFVLWLPYLVAYWPGFIFLDSLGSLKQVVGVRDWINHHPAIYTAWIGFCVNVMRSLGFSVTSGFGLYSIIQMVCMALTLSYCANWIKVRWRLGILPLGVMLVVFGCSTYFATFSMTVWKDPVFSMAVTLATLRIFDLVWRKTRPSWGWLASFCVFVLTMSLVRSNGLAVGALVFVVFVMVGIGSKKTRKVYLPSAISAGAAVLVAAIVIGPVYHALGIADAPPEESAGIAVSQMARVAALDGDMSDSDRQFMDSLLPLDRYRDAYRPASIDLLKWDPEFDGTSLKEGLLPHWVSMLSRNPKVFFEAWELQTFGFWTVNVECVNSYDKSIASGGLVFLTDEGKAAASDLDVHVKSGPQESSSTAGILQNFDGWFVPIGWINWLIVVIVLLCGATRQWRLALGLIPSIGLALTLVASSPLWYCPRYGAPEQFLLPVFIALLASLVGSPKAAFEKKDSCRGDRLEVCMR